MGAAVTVIALLGCADTAAAQRSAPIRVEFTVPPDLKAGDEVTTLLRFRAQEDVDRLRVEVLPFLGLQVLSEPRELTFSDVKKGTAPELEVRVRLTDPKVGSLGVTFQTQAGSRKRAGAITVEYILPK